MPSVPKFNGTLLNFKATAKVKRLKKKMDESEIRFWREAVVASNLLKLLSESLYTHFVPEHWPSREQTLYLSL